MLMPEASSQSSRRPLMSASTIIMVNSKRIVLKTAKGLCWKQQSASTSYRTRIFTTKNSASGRRRPGRLPMSISGEPQKSAKLKESIIVSISPDLESKIKGRHNSIHLSRPRQQKGHKHSNIMLPPPPLPPPAPKLSIFICERSTEEYGQMVPSETIIPHSWWPTLPSSALLLLSR